MKKLLLLMTIALLINIQTVYCDIREKILNVTIAVEKITGRGEEYDVNFSGWVGALSFHEQEKIILISELTSIESKISIISGLYKITKLEKYDKSIEFECVDTDALTAGIQWRGKIWLTDDDKIKIEMVQKKSSRKWQNISDYGWKFLKDNHIEKLNLGV